MQDHPSPGRRLRVASAKQRPEQLRDRDQPEVVTDPPAAVHVANLGVRLSTNANELSTPIGDRVTVGLGGALDGQINHSCAARRSEPFAAIPR